MGNSPSGRQHCKRIYAESGFRSTGLITPLQSAMPAPLGKRMRRGRSFIRASNRWVIQLILLKLEYLGTLPRTRPATRLQWLRRSEPGRLRTRRPEGTAAGPMQAADEDCPQPGCLPSSSATAVRMRSLPRKNKYRPYLVASTQLPLSASL